jgi:hypothetical protein
MVPFVRYVGKCCSGGEVTDENEKPRIRFAC